MPKIYFSVHEADSLISKFRRKIERVAQLREEILVIDNTKIFFDDITHVKPFSIVTLNQILELTDFKGIEVYKFRQLPMTWHNPVIRVLSVITSLISPPRVKQKWFRWSRELMLASVGIKSD